MVVQKEIDLNKPLDANAAPVLAKTTLKPGYQGRHCFARRSLQTITSEVN